jgi:hypothetical protein
VTSGCASSDREPLVELSRLNSGVGEVEERFGLPVDHATVSSSAA